ncbi:hypothetical protein PVT67_14060 [Gallaecimonas kandeliae]|uniref:hypothetical protein n=1 Tax=Gallaecimonas kandeliae TaxID=3029055 RepID=UPI00264920B3|nr:hypothetical protein [Gallaecimonas kandeliae]WKE64779.1 hypothetical protein PVT67_14060 [Gallaecimonas kandeliae]
MPLLPLGAPGGAPAFFPAYRHLARPLLLLAALLLGGCFWLFDDSFGYRGPIIVTVETLDGKVPEHPFVIDVAYTEVGSHGLGGKRGYKHIKLAYAGRPVTFPRERLDLALPNDAANIGFLVFHPGYFYSYDRYGFPPNKADKPYRITIKMRPLEMVLGKVEKEADAAKAELATLQAGTEAYRKKEGEYQYLRYRLGDIVGVHNGQVKRRYLPHIPEALRQSVIDKYHPILEALYYSIPETDCGIMVSGCQEELKKKKGKREFKYNGI